MPTTVIPTDILRFDIGWKRLQIYNFNYTKKHDDQSWVSMEDTTATKGLKNIKIFQNYWIIKADYLQSTQAFLLNNELVCLPSTVGWQLCLSNNYAMCVTFRASELFEEYTMLPTVICMEIASYHTEQQEHVRLSKDGIFQLNAVVDDKILSVHIHEILIESFSSLVYIHELEEHQGSMNIVSISHIEWYLKPIQRAKGDIVVFTSNGTEPNNSNKLDVTDYTWKLQLTFIFIGTRETYRIPITEILVQKRSRPSFQYALLKIFPGAEALTALRMGNGPTLIVLGQIWKRYFENSWQTN